MKGWQMYSRIQALKEQGFSIRKISRIIRVSRNTITKYWDMEPEEYASKYKAINRITALTAYEPIILKWLEAYPCMSAAQVRDWLAEKYQMDTAERTVRRLVADMREKYSITKETEQRREYEAVEELPIGYQLQLDFGAKTARDAYSSRYIKLYFVVFTLTYSRYKWGYFQEQPFLSSDLVSALYKCFDYFGGMPRQLVYDQDSIIVVSENGGDIIHTQAFTSFLAETKLGVRVCRKSDPETKGVIEASVKFVKRNFMEHRLYMGIGIWNKSFEDWLIRTGNGKQHGTTKRKPAEMFSDEQVHLLPLYGVAPAVITEAMDRNVRQDNTVLYRSNRYSVPYGTYSTDKEVFLTADGGRLHIINRAGDTLAEHGISNEKGKLIRLESHRRNKSEKLKTLRDKALALLGEEFRDCVDTICARMPRYVKEQLDIIIKACQSYGRECVVSAMLYCQRLELFSANDLRDAAEMLSGYRSQQMQPSRLPVENERYHIPVQARALSVYAGVASRSGVTQ